MGGNGKAISIRTKVLIIVALLFFIPLILQTVFVTDLLRGSLLENIIKVSEKNTENVAILIGDLLLRQLDTTANIATSPVVKELLSESPDSEHGGFYKLKRYILSNETDNSAQYPFTYILIAGDRLYSSYSYGGLAGSRALLRRIETADWYKKATSSYFPVTEIVRSENLLISGGSDQLYFVRNIIHDGVNVGAVITGIDAYYVEDLLGFNNLDSYILSKNGDVLLSGTTNSGRLLPGDIDASRVLGGAEDDGKLTVNHVRFVLKRHVLRLSADNEVILLTAEPERLLFDEVNKITAFSVIMGLLSISGLILVILLFSRYVLTPIEQMYHGMKAVREGNLDLELDFNSQDEIGGLATGFNEMTVRIKKNIESIRAVEAEKRRLEIGALSSQMRPHFVRNILTSVRWMADLSGSEGICRTILALSDMLEYNFRNKEIFTSVREETDYLQKYVYMQQIRYQNRFRVKYNVGEELSDCRILKLILQPIVENSIVHGALPKKAITTIEISGRLDGDRLYFEIVDNGAGIERPKLDAILVEDEETDREHGIALSNIEKRIKLHCGREYGLRIDSEPGKGTAVTVTLPHLVS